MPVDWTPLWLSLRVAVLATAIALALGLWLGWKRLDVFAAFPLAFPPTIVCSYFLFRRFNWEIAMAAGIVYAAPFLARSAARSFRSAGAAYENTARSLGASEWR